MRHSSNVRSLSAYRRRKLNRNAVQGLRSVLATFGYDIVPKHPSASTTGRRHYRKLACPRCSRRFALPMNLGRHLSASHGRKAKAA